MSKGYPDFYERISAPWRRMDRGAELLGRIDSVLRIGIVALYVALVVWLFATSNDHLLRAVVVPLVTFLLVTGARILIDAPRPYEAYAISPLVAKDTRGRSMPSRHMASATIIACTLLWAAGPIWGAVGFAACAIVAYTRIVGGVHFPRDVAAGAALAVLCALVGFVLIP